MLCSSCLVFLSSCLVVLLSLSDVSLLRPTFCGLGPEGGDQEVLCLVSKKWPARPRWVVNQESQRVIHEASSPPHRRRRIQSAGYPARTTKCFNTAFILYLVFNWNKTPHYKWSGALMFIFFLLTFSF